MDLQDILSELTVKHNLILGKPFELGNICKTIYPAKKDGDSLVVKIGFDLESAKEVRMNWAGYQNLKSINASDLIPDKLIYLVIQNVPILVMQNCGKDFWHSSKTHKEPINLYKELICGLKPVYEKTLNKNIPPTTSLEMVLKRLISQWETHLGSLIDNNLLIDLKNTSFSEYSNSPSCFSSFDFTPEDVFVNKYGVKYVDPHTDNFGLPVIDLACFAGVARDAYSLPGSEDGYDLLYNFACKDLTRLFSLTEKQLSALFSLGRSLQCALSARFRLETEPEKASTMTSSSMYFARNFIDNSNNR